MDSETVFYAGMALMAAAVVAGLVTAAVMGLRSRHLRRQLESEYGQLK